MQPVVKPLSIDTAGFSPQASDSPTNYSEADDLSPTSLPQLATIELDLEVIQPPPPFSLPQLVLPVYLPGAIAGFIKGIEIICIPLFVRRELNGGDAMAGLAVALDGVGAVVCAIPSGLLVAKCGNRICGIASLLLYAVVSVLCAGAPTIHVLLPLRFLTGTAMALFLVSRQTLLAERVPTEMRGRAMSLLGGATRAAGVVGPLAGGLIAQHYSVRFGFLAVGAAMLLGALLSLCAPAAVSDDDDTNAGSPSSPLRQKAKTPTSPVQILWTHRRVFATTGLFCLILSFLRKAKDLAIPLQAVHQDLSADQLGYVGGMMTALDAVMFPAAGLLMDKCGRKWNGAIAASVISGAFALLPFATDFKTLAATAALAGAGNGLSSGLVMTLGADSAPVAERGEFLGVYRTITGMGDIVGPAVTGALAQTTSLQVNAWVSCVVGIAGVVWLLLTVHETLNKDKLSESEEVPEPEFEPLPELQLECEPDEDEAFEASDTLGQGSKPHKKEDEESCEEERKSCL